MLNNKDLQFKKFAQKSLRNLLQETSV